MEYNYEDLQASNLGLGDVNFDYLCKTYLGSQLESLQENQDNSYSLSALNMEPFRPKANPTKWRREDCERWAQRVLSPYTQGHENLDLWKFTSYTGAELLMFTENDFAGIVGVKFSSLLYNEMQRIKETQFAGINASLQSVDDDDQLLQEEFGDDYVLFNPGLSSSSQAESLTYQDPMHNGATGNNYESPFTFDDPIHHVFDEICSQGANRYDTPAGEPSTSFVKTENFVSDFDKLILEESYSLDPDTIKEEPHGATAASLQLLIPNEEVLGKIPATRRRRVRGPKNWEFLMRLLVDPRANPSLIEWEDEANATFRLKQPSIIAQMWGSRNPDQGDLTYNNFVRGLRYRFRTGQLIHIPGRQFVYGCGPKALEFLEELRQLRN